MMNKHSDNFFLYPSLTTDLHLEYLCSDITGITSPVAIGEQPSALGRQMKDGKKSCAITAVLKCTPFPFCSIHNFQ